MAGLPLAGVGLVLPHLWVWPLASLLIAGSLYASGNRVALSALLAKETAAATRAKLLGDRAHRVSTKLEALQSRPLRGFIALALIVLGVGSTIALSAAAVTYSLINDFDVSNPFRTNPGRVDVLLYFADEAVRGMAFHFFDVAGIGVPNKLQINPHGPFAFLVWAYRGVMFILTAQVLWLGITFARAKIDPRSEHRNERLEKLERLELEEEAKKLLNRLRAAGYVKEDDRDEVEQVVDLLAWHVEQNGRYGDEWSERFEIMVDELNGILNRSRGKRRRRRRR